MNPDASSDRPLSGNGSRSRPPRLLWVLLAAAAVARVGVLWTWSDNLSDDRDVYLALAEGIAEGRGYSVHDTQSPTAYRPPLYPLVLAVSGTSHSPTGRGLLHLVLGISTVWLTFVLGRRLGMSDRLCLFAAALVAFDPLLLRYTTLPMTETLSTFLATALLVCLTLPSRPWQQMVIGVVFGMNVLCRPTLWGFAGLMLMWWAVTRWRRTGEADRETGRARRSVPWIGMAAVLFVVTPWVARNAIVMRSPILMTTHGGYTLLLGNNPSFYHEVVDQAWGTVWDGSHGDGQAVWAASVNLQLDEAGIIGEVARDRYMARLAREHIREQPGMFLRACLLRLRRFWSLVPQGDAGKSIPSSIRLPVAVLYGAVFLLATIGLIRVWFSDSIRWCPLVLLIVTFVSVHLVYWSNARMRSPIVPAVSLLAARSLSTRRILPDDR